MRGFAVSCCAFGLVTLGACSSGGETPVDPVVLDPDRPTQAELYNAYEDLHGDFVGSTVTPPASLPTVGTARYSGVMSADFQVFSAMGEVALAVSFDRPSDPVTGVAGHFVTDRNQALEGELEFSDGAISWGSQPSLSLHAEGELMLDDHAYGLSVDMEGSFRNDATLLHASGLGALTLDGASYGSSYQHFIARQD